MAEKRRPVGRGEGGGVLRTCLWLFRRIGTISLDSNGLFADNANGASVFFAGGFSAFPGPFPCRKEKLNCELFSRRGRVPLGIRNADIPVCNNADRIIP